MVLESRICDIDIIASPFVIIDLCCVDLYIKPYFTNKLKREIKQNYVDHTTNLKS